MIVEYTIKMIRRWECITYENLKFNDPAKEGLKPRFGCIYLDSIINSFQIELQFLFCIRFE